MQFRLPVAVFVFLGSYLPLSVILLAQDYEYGMLPRPICLDFFSESIRCVLPFRNPAYSLGIFVACLFCFVLTFVVLALVRTKAKRMITIKEAKYIPTELMNYTLPYVVAFMSIDYHETRKFVGFLIFLGWMFWITYKSGQIILNPLLIVFGWRLYEISYAFVGNNTEHNGTALADSMIASGERHRHTAVQDVIIVRTAREGEG